MPEVCEVVLTSQYLTTKLKNRYITSIRVVAGKYTHQTLSGRDLIAKHKPLKITKIDTKGKFMWFELRDPNGIYIYIMNNFGLTGEWSFKNDKSDRVLFDIETHPDDPDKNKKYVLHYADARNFGLLQITHDKQVLDNKINKLAPDFLKTNFTTNEFIAWVNKYLQKSPKRKDVPIVVALLKQDKKDGIGSGIGNYLSSEILYRAKISPHTPVGKLTHEQLVMLSNKIKYVLKLCYMSNITGYMKKLSDFVEQHRIKVEEGKFPNYHPDIHLKPDETFEFMVYGREEDDYGNKIIRERIDAQRDTYWCPKVQK